MRSIKVQELVGRKRFDSVLFLLAVRRLEELNWAVDGCLGWCNYDYRAREV